MPLLGHQLRCPSCTQNSCDRKQHKYCTNSNLTSRYNTAVSIIERASHGICDTQANVFFLKYCVESKRIQGSISPFSSVKDCLSHLYMPSSHQSQMISACGLFQSQRYDRQVAPCHYKADCRVASWLLVRACLYFQHEPQMWQSQVRYQLHSSSRRA